MLFQGSSSSVLAILLFNIKPGTIFDIFSAQCILGVNNGVSGKNIIRKFVPVAHYSIAEMIICNVKLKLRGLKFKTMTFGGNSGDRGSDMS